MILGTQGIRPMRRDGDEDRLRFVLVTTFLLALVAILIVVALFVHQA